MLPDLGAEFAPDMNMIRVVPTATSEFGPSFSQMLEININFCSTRYGNSGKSTAQYNVIISNYT